MFTFLIFRDEIVCRLSYETCMKEIPSAVAINWSTSLTPMNLLLFHGNFFALVNRINDPTRRKNINRALVDY